MIRRKDNGVALPQTYPRHGVLTVFESVPMMLCDSCGQSYLYASTIKTIEQVLGDLPKYTKKKSVNVCPAFIEVSK